MKIGLTRKEAIKHLSAFARQTSTPLRESLALALADLRTIDKQARSAHLGGRARAAKYTKRQLSRMGKLGGRPRKTAA